MQTTQDLLQELFTYNRQMNQKLIAFFRTQALEDAAIFRLFSHTLNAHHIWLSRIAGQTPQYGVWQEHAAHVFDPLDAENYRQTMELLRNTDDFQREIAYQTFAGEAYVNRLGDMLMHTVNHATYHRGQIARLIREKGFNPPNTDYILYQRDTI